MVGVRRSPPSIVAVKRARRRSNPEGRLTPAGFDLYRTRRSHRLLDGRGRGDDLGRLGGELGIVALAPAFAIQPRGPAGRADKRMKKAPAEAGAFLNRSAGRSEVALDAETSAPLVLFARRERACLRTRRDGRDYPSRNDPETRALVQV